MWNEYTQKLTNQKKTFQTLENFKLDWKQWFSQFSLEFFCRCLCLSHLIVYSSFGFCSLGYSILIWSTAKALLSPSRRKFSEELKKGLRAPRNSSLPRAWENWLNKMSVAFFVSLFLWPIVPNESKPEKTLSIFVFNTEAIATACVCAFLLHFVANLQTKCIDIWKQSISLDPETIASNITQLYMCEMGRILNVCEVIVGKLVLPVIYISF